MLPCLSKELHSEKSPDLTPWSSEWTIPQVLPYLSVPSVDLGVPLNWKKGMNTSRKPCMEQYSVRMKVMTRFLQEWNQILLSSWAVRLSLRRFRPMSCFASRCWARRTKRRSYWNMPESWNTNRLWNRFDCLEASFSLNYRVVELPTRPRSMMPMFLSLWMLKAAVPQMNLTWKEPSWPWQKMLNKN